MDYINIKVPATPAIESLVAALLQQSGVSASCNEPPPDFITLREGAKIAGVTAAPCTIPVQLCG